MDQIKLTPDITLLIDGYIEETWSPEQIAGRLKIDNVIFLHHETIYNYVLKNKESGRMLRQYFPKSMELNNVSEKEVNYAIDKLNSRPRKILGYLTPYEAFEKFTELNIKKLTGHALMT
ncbi:MAG: hypothetical protein HQK83_14980 [Fibrobacteria bacterium]|nr:hypothetical protein [Fibrobacteria bacterium]